MILFNLSWKLLTSALHMCFLCSARDILENKKNWGASPFSSSFLSGTLPLFFSGHNSSTELSSSSQARNMAGFPLEF